MKITAALLKEYFNDEKKYAYYEEAKKAAAELSIHANGEFPKALIEERRPSESLFIKDYRKKIWQPVTKVPLSKVISELGKIRKADDWSIRYDTSTFSSSIKQGETLQDYCEFNFPFFTSVTNWVFTVLLKSYLLESNSVILTIPLNTIPQKGEYRKPFPFWFPCENVFEFMEEEFCVLKSRDKSRYTENGKDYHDGDIFYVVDKERIIRYEQVNSKRDFEPKMTFEHKLGYMPAFKTKGLYMKSQEKYYLYESRIACMLPNLNEAVREYSDLQAEVVQHVHSKEWSIVTQNCTACNGTGKVIKQGQAPIECEKCKGVGRLPTSPYDNVAIKLPKVGEQQVPIPPGGYYDRDVQIVKIQDERIDKHIYKALSAVNMEHLAEVPLVQSGVAKAMDEEGANNFANAVAEDIVAIMDTLVGMINDYRYMDIVSDIEKRKLMKPKIAVPTKLNILPVEYLVDEAGKLKTANVSPLIVNASEIELANKKFANDPTVRDMLVCVFDLDPLSGISSDDKMSMLQNKGISHEDYVISCNIQRLVKQAFQKDKDFASKKYDEKMKVIKSLAAPLIASMKAEIETENPEVDEKGNPVEKKSVPA